MNRLNALKKIFVFFFTELPCYSFISPLYYLFSSFSPVVSTVLLKEIFECAYNIIKNDSNSIVPFFKYGTYFIMFHLINVLLESITSISTNAGIYERSKYLLNLKITEKSASLPLIKYEDENGNYGKLSVVTNKKKSNITLTMKDDEDTFDIKIDNTVNEKNKTVQSNITANVLYEKNTYKIEISNDSKYGNNLVNPKTFTDAKDFEKLSDDDYMEVYTNVQNIISKLGISNTEL